MSLCFLVPTELAPPIIGPRGSAVRRLVGESGASIIHLSNHDVTIPDRRVTIRGSVDAIHAAFDLISDVLRAECGRVGRPDVTLSVRLVVPEATSIISEAALSELRSAHAVTVQLSSSPAAGAAMERVLSVGGDASHISRVVKHVVSRVTERHQHRLSGFFARWAFPTDYNDHFTTPRRAYADILPLLHAIAGQQARRVKPAPGAAGCPSPNALAELVIYDPYYCDGSVVADLVALGCSASRVINRNRDFYADISRGETPREYGVLVTNPPYSADHKQKLLDFLLTRPNARGAAGAVEGGGAGGGSASAGGAARAVPFLLLMPAWLCDKEYWRAFLRRWVSVESAPGDSAEARVSGRGRPSGAVEELERAAGVFYVCPRERYGFAHPQATGHAESPFHAVWYCGGWPTDQARRKAMRALKRFRTEGRVEVFRSAGMMKKRGYY